jgi:hypothetical protein
MKLWLRTSVAAVFAAASLSTTTGVFAEPRVEENEQGLCRRAPEPLMLPPERMFEEQTMRLEGSSPERRVPPPDLSAPPTPTPMPMAVEGGDESESIVVTGARAPLSFSETTTGLVLDRGDLEDAAAGEDDADTDRGSAFRHRDRRQPQPEAGLLTAGDHDDLLNPDLYARYVDGFLEHETLEGVPRVDTQRVLTIKVEDRAGRAVPFAAVTLTCGDGNRLTLRTLANGAAVFFPELDRLGERVSVSVSHQGATTRATGVSVSGRARAQERTVTVDSAAGQVRRFDLALVVDTTGSMTDELEYLKTELAAIIDALHERHDDLDIRIALVVYRDTGDAYVTRTFGFTSNVGALHEDLSRQVAGGGGDYPEAVEEAMARAVALDWRPDAVRSLLLVADAPPHADDVAATWRSAEVARHARIQIVPVGASGVGPGAEYVMRAMAAVTQSRYIFLTDDSGIGNTHAPPSVDCYLVTSLETLIQRVLDGQISGRRVEPDEAEVIRAVGTYSGGRCLAPR